MAASKARRPHTQAIREVIGRSPATLDEIASQTWMMFPAGPCIARWRRDVDGRRSKRGSARVGYDLDLDEQHRAGAKALIRQALVSMMHYGVAVKEGDRYRLL